MLRQLNARHGHLHSFLMSSVVDDATIMEQELYGVNELDANLWKAYFRANAEYITRWTILLLAAAPPRGSWRNVGLLPECTGHSAFTSRFHSPPFARKTPKKVFQVHGPVRARETQQDGQSTGGGSGYSHGRYILRRRRREFVSTCFEGPKHDQHVYSTLLTTILFSVDKRRWRTIRPPTARHDLKRSCVAGVHKSSTQAM